jgi:predicted nucleic acid-binding protein
MNSFRRVYCDTNIFIRIFEGRDEIARHLLRLLGAIRPREPTFLVTSELTLAEVLVAPYRLRKDGLFQRYDDAIMTGGMLEVGPVDRSVLYFAAVLRADYRKLKLPDAIHLSTAFGFGCTHFLTFDRLESEYTLSHERWGYRRGEARLEVIEPSALVIDALIESASV